MREAERITERLRRGFAALDETERAEGECPSPERIWDGAHGRLTSRTAKQVVTHLAECASCAADWRLAMRSEEPTPLAVAKVGRLGGRRAMVGAAAAAVLVLGVVGILNREEMIRPPEPTYRSDDALAVRSQLPDGGVLTREEATLRWTAVGEGARYSVEVGLPDLTPLSAAHDLREPRYRIPRSALESVEPGGTVVWQVESRLPDGRRIVSEAFLAKIE